MCDLAVCVCVCVCAHAQLAQSVIELNNQIQQKDKEIQSNAARSVSAAGSGWFQPSGASLRCRYLTGRPGSAGARLIS